MPINHRRSAYGRDGRILFYGSRDFIRDICLGDQCFICGASPEDVVFNDEHVISNWLLKKYKLQQVSVTLPNGSRRFYGQHKLPCCVSCNDLLGRTVENPVSKLIARGHAGLGKSDRSISGPALAQWLMQSFFKLMLMDGRLRNNRHTLSGDDTTIAGQRDWKTLHHLHALVRAPYTKARLAPPNLYGSFLTFRVLEDDRSFDLQTFPDEQTIYIQVGDLGMILVIGDDHRVIRYHEPFLRSLRREALSTPQAREVATRFAYINSRFKNRPEFRTIINKKTDEVTIEQMGSAFFSMYEPDHFELAAELSKVLFGEPMLRDGQLVTMFPEISVPGTMQPIFGPTSPGRRH